MKRISLWGYHHKWAARLLIVLCYGILNVVGFLAGDLLYWSGTQVSGFFVYLCTFTFLAAAFLYPLRSEKHRYRNFYAFQKLCDGILITTTFLLIISAANLREKADTPFRFPAAQAIVPVTPHPYKTPAAVRKEHRHSFIKLIEKKLVRAVQSVRNFWKSRSSAEKVILIVLAVLLAMAGILGILGLSCNLSCAGNEGAALAVGVLGVGLIIFLFVLALRGIRRTYPATK